MATATSDTLFPLPEPTPLSMDSWEDRLDVFTRLAKARGGLVPMGAVPDILDISKQRVHQLVSAGRLEKITYFSQNFVSGRSIREWMADEHVATGRSNKKAGLWKSMVIGLKAGVALGNVIVPDQE